MGITWEFVEAVADVITLSAKEQQQLLATARPLWERVLANAELEKSNQATDVVAAMREMLDLSQELREIQRHLADLRAEDQNLAWALVMTCQQMRTRIVALRANQGQAGFHDVSVPSSAPQENMRVDDEQTAHMLEEWARRIARLAQALVRTEDTRTPSAGNVGVTLSEAIETTLWELDQEFSQVTRALEHTASASAAFSRELTDPDPQYAGGGFLRAVRLDSERLVPERLFPEVMNDAVVEPGQDRVLTIPMIGLMCQGITIAPGITVLAGPNGVGKSVALEALSHVLQGQRAHRALDYRPLSRRLAAALEITFHHRPRPQDVWYASFLSLRKMRNPRLSAGESFRIALEEMSPKRGVLYLLDEPEAGLSPPLTEELISWMNDRVEDGCQFIIATHSMTLASLEQAQVIMPSR
ncbi:AAA family ATPase [Streptomyces umbrinus]